MTVVFPYARHLRLIAFLLAETESAARERSMAKASTSGGKASGSKDAKSGKDAKDSKGGKSTKK